MIIKKLLLKNSQSGMTLIEVLAVTLILGILATLAVPNWFIFLSQQKLNKANETIELLIRQAQNKAKRENVAYTIEFQLDEDNQLEYQNIKGSAEPDDEKWQFVLNQQEDLTVPLAEGSKINFNHDGTINNDGGEDYLKVNEKIVMSLDNLNPSPKRCVIIKTLLGAIETGKNEDCVSNEN